MIVIRYENTDAIKGALEDEGSILAHVVNDVGVMGRGIALGIKKQWPEVEKAYTDFFISGGINMVGSVQFVEVASGKVTVANMFAQHLIRLTGAGTDHIQYDWLQRCLDRLFEEAHERDANIHMPKIGTVFAGGDWDRIWAMVVQSAVVNEYEGTLYLHRFIP